MPINLSPTRMATYYDKAFDLASTEERFHVVRPWWDLMSQITIQFSMIIAVTSISLDVFSQFGTGVKCIPRNVTHAHGIQQVSSFAGTFLVSNFLFT